MTPRDQVIWVAAILALVAIVDFAQRVHVPRAPATREATLEIPALPDPPLALASARQRLQSWLPAPETESQDPATGVRSESRDSAAQIPDTAEIGGWRFVLLGVFDAGRPFAVFDVMSTAGGDMQQHRVSAGEEINGVRIDRISGRSVSLRDGEKTIYLALFIDPENNMAPAREQDE